MSTPNIAYLVKQTACFNCIWWEDYKNEYFTVLYITGGTPWWEHEILIKYDMGKGILMWIIWRQDFGSKKMNKRSGTDIFLS